MQLHLRVEGLSKSFGVLELFKNIGFVVNKGDKTALIAKNGAGKTTLLNILTNQMDYNDGLIEWHPDTRVAYLSQNPELNNDNTVIDEVFTNNTQQTQTIKAYEKALLKNDADEISLLSSGMDQMGLWDYESRVKSILSQLHLNEFNKKVKELSGGQKKRVGLAQVLINEPDFLILDEPTNHLDVNTIEWLEDYLKRSTLTLLMVTHDRYFMDRVCTCILELDDIRNHIHRHEGGYENFLRRREERLHSEQQEIDKAQNLLRTEEEWMRRMPKARSTKAKYRIDKVYELRETASNQRHDDLAKIKSAETRLGKKIIDFKHVDYFWGDVAYLKDFNYSFTRTERLGILGTNGSGKSTFLDVLTGKLQPVKGTVEKGDTVKIGYYSQQGMLFDNNEKVIDAVHKIAETVKIDDKTTVTASQFLNYFLFPPKRQHDFIAKLSGGEKRRLYLCIILMQSPNFLILDEPTNDLDLPTLEILEAYLASFKGCVIVVSHDRYFMDAIVDHLFIFKGGAKIKDFPGNYSQYFEKQKQLQQAVKANSETKTQKPARENSKSTSKNKLSYKEKRELESLEMEMEQLNQEKAEVEGNLSSGKLNNNELHKASERIGEIMKLLDNKEMRWLELSEKEG